MKAGRNWGLLQAISSLRLVRTLLIAPVGQASGNEDPLAKADPWSAKVLEGDLGFSFDFLTSEFSEGECELYVELLRYSSILKLPSGI